MHIRRIAYFILTPYSVRKRLPHHKSGLRPLTVTQLSYRARRDIIKTWAKPYIYTLDEEPTLSLSLMALKKDKTTTNQGHGH